MDMGGIFGVDGEALQHPKVRANPSVLKATWDEKAKLKYAEAVGKQWEELKVRNRLMRVECRGKEIKEGMATGSEQECGISERARKWMSKRRC